MSNQKELSEDFDEESTLKDLLSLDLSEDLNKEAFLQEDFNVDEFLKKIYKFHTLEDLQIKLKELLETIEKDFVALIQDKYDNFFKLTSDILKNENKLIDLSVHLTKFKNEVQKVRDTIQQNILYIDEELHKKSKIYIKKVLAMNLLHINMMIEDIQGLLSPINKSKDYVDLPILQEAVKSYISLKYYLSLVPSEHPFIKERKEKIQTVHNNLFNSLAFTLDKCRKDTPNEENLLKILQIYRELDASAEACRQLYKIK
ncbi:hypothetical protein PCANB_002029 [Pneumocystis canis]|nr:hypothetical protein PCK1_001917 [Pneumocystis canis]KAG5439455.1 hypothetical protein PCANB_002029 [Pneumocystis canis]